MYLRLQPAVDREVRTFVGLSVCRVHEVRRAADLVDQHHRLGAGPARRFGVIGVQCIVIFAFDDEHAAHAVGHVDRSRAVLVRMVPLGAR